MTSMAKTAPTGRAARLLAVLAVLLGLLAMHGVASAHHAAATPAIGPIAPATAAAHVHDHNAAGALAPADHRATAALTGPVIPACQDDCRVVTALCVAVLTAVAVALLLSRRRAFPLLHSSVQRPSRAPAPRVRLTQRPDPVRELCISRT